MNRSITFPIGYFPPNKSKHFIASGLITLLLLITTLTLLYFNYTNESKTYLSFSLDTKTNTTAIFTYQIGYIPIAHNIVSIIAMIILLIIFLHIRYYNVFAATKNYKLLGNILSIFQFIKLTLMFTSSTFYVKTFGLFNHLTPLYINIFIILIVDIGVYQLMTNVLFIDITKNDDSELILNLLYNKCTTNTTNYSNDIELINLPSLHMTLSRRSNAKSGNTYNYKRINNMDSPHIII